MKSRISVILMVLACGIIVAAERTAVKRTEYLINISFVDESTPRKVEQRFSIKTDGKI